MANFTETARITEFEDGTKKRILVKGHEILLARVNNSFYATDNLCPHLRGNLSAGKLEGTVISCPLQGSQFDIRDGKVLRWLRESATSPKAGETLRPPQPLKTYKVRIEGDRILINI